jgi:hypothetical protein
LESKLTTPFASWKKSLSGSDGTITKNPRKLQSTSAVFYKELGIGLKFSSRVERTALHNESVSPMRPLRRAIWPASMKSLIYLSLSSRVGTVMCTKAMQALTKVYVF